MTAPMVFAPLLPLIALLGFGREALAFPARLQSCRAWAPGETGWMASGNLVDGAAVGAGAAPCEVQVSGVVQANQAYTVTVNAATASLFKLHSSDGQCLGSDASATLRATSKNFAWTAPATIPADGINFYALCGSGFSASLYASAPAQLCPAGGCPVTTTTTTMTKTATMTMDTTTTTTETTTTTMAAATMTTETATTTMDAANLTVEATTTTMDAASTTMEAATTMMEAATTTVEAATTTVEAATTTMEAATTTMDAATTMVGAATTTMDAATTAVEAATTTTGSAAMASGVVGTVENLELREGLSLSFRPVGSDSMEFVVKAQWSTWVGIGLSHGSAVSMVGGGQGSDIVYCSDNEVRRRWVTSKFIQAGSGTLVTGASCTRENGQTTLTFTRPIQAASNQERSVMAGAQQQVIWAFGADGELAVTNHQTRRGGKFIDFALGSVASAATSGNAALYCHLTLMILAWCLLLSGGTE